MGLLQALSSRVESLKEQWANGVFTDQSQFATAIKNAKAIGNCELCDWVVALDFEQLESELKDE